MNIDLLRSTFATVAPQADDLARAFYGRMLSTFPQVRPLFAQTDFDQQRVKLIQSLAAVVALVDKPGELSPVLEKLGKSHVGYAVTPTMYPYVTYSLLTVLAEFLGDDWTEEAATTWEGALLFVSQAMIEAQEAAAA
ncbi:MAG: hemoglobin-like flavoprotein [Pseudohongiellaceae bacterium]|jgi:hemoglobin-like flavoprotein